MVQVKFGSDYLNVDNCEDGDIATITGEGELGEITYNGKTKEVLNIPVEINDKIMVYTPAMKAGRALVEAYGDDTKDWIGKQFQTFNVDSRLVIKTVK